MKRNSKGKTVFSVLLFFGLVFSILPITKSMASLPSKDSVKANSWLREMKPVAGRNRRFAKSIVTKSLYPKANPDTVQFPSEVDKIRINVLSNDEGHKLRLVGVNARSAKGARVSIRHGMAVYQAPQDFVGKDSFWYTLEDQMGRGHSAKVIVCICGR